MTTSNAPIATTRELYQEVQQFYARQMHLLDAGQAEQWSETFTEDGVFAANAHPEPSVGRANIAAAVRRAVDDLAARRVVRRHWLGMLDVEAITEDSARARSYALVIETPIGGSTDLRLSTTCEDLLVRHGDRWLVQERRVARDDL